MKFAMNNKVLNILPPDADRFGAAGSTGPRGVLGGASPVTAIVDVRNYRHVTFIAAYGLKGATTTTFLMEGCNLLVTPTIHTEIPFEYFPGGAGTTGSYQMAEQLGTMALATTSGYLTTSGQSNQIVIMEVDVPEAEAAYRATNAGGTMIGIRLTCTESKDEPADGCVIAILSEPRFAGEGDAQMPTGLSLGT